MLVLHQSNRLENLAASLAALMHVNPPSALAAQPILVASPGMGTWLQVQLAQAHGIAAGYTFLLPARWLWQQYRQLHQQVPERSVWDKAPLTWVLWQHLDEICADPDCAALRNYLGDEQGGDALKRYRLCVRLADLYDQYQMHRPDWLQAWAQQRSPVAVPDSQCWQPALWRKLQQWLPDDDARRSILMDARHWQALLSRARAGDLPERLVLFATGNLSAALLQVLQVFGKHCEVHLFIFNPSQEYWGDLESRRAYFRRRLQQPDQSVDENVFSQQGNPLLATLGEQGRSQLELILGAWDAFDVDLDSFEAPDPTRLLGRLQADIFYLNDGATAPVPLPDANISLHACHSAMREVEVLHDRLLDLFAADPTLKPRDVIVMVPDVSPYAALVEAVFGAEPATLPWAVADRTLAEEVPLVRALLMLLKPSVTRYTANEVFDLLDVAALRRRFGLSVQDLPLLRQWVAEAGIRWGLDAAHRQSLGFPPDERNSWQWGVRRMLLAVAGGEQPLHWQSVLSLGAIQNSQVVLVGQLASLVSSLQRQLRWMLSPRRPREWQAFLLMLLDELFDGDEQDQLDLESVRSAISDWVQDMTLAGVDTPLPVDVVHAVLAAEFGRASGGQRFLAGAINICTLMPMRTVPFKVVCLLGMNENDYPHREHPPGYDLTVQYPRMGDRSRRVEDRYLFLEALLAAREHLYVSWCGRDIRSNESLPPSVVVADMIDYIDRAFDPVAGVPAGQSLIVEHSLQPFSRKQFLSAYPAQHSWSSHWYAVATAEGATLESDALPDWGMPDHLDVDALVQFLANPAAACLRERFGVRLAAGIDELDDDEPASLSGLERWQLRNETAAEKLRSPSLLPLAERWWLEGRVPPGPAGAQSLQQEIAVADAFAERVRAQWPAMTDKQTVTVCVENVSLSVTLNDVSADGWVYWSASALFEKAAKKTPWQERLIRPGRILGAWVAHLLLNASVETGEGRVTRGWYEDCAVVFAPLSAATALANLSALLAMYRQGMQGPMAVLPQSAWALEAGLLWEPLYAAERDASLAAIRLLPAQADEAALGQYAALVWRAMRDHLEVTDDASI